MNMNEELRSIFYTLWMFAPAFPSVIQCLRSWKFYTTEWKKGTLYIAQQIYFYRKQKI